MLRLLYSLHRRSAGQWHWLRRRFTRPGLVVLGAAVAAGFMGVDTDHSVAYQAFMLLAAVLLLALLFGWIFRLRFAVTRALPRFGTAGQPFTYRMTVQNFTAKTQTGLTLLDNLADTRPAFHEWRAAWLEDKQNFRSLRFSPGPPPHLFQRATVKEAVVPPIPPRQTAEVALEILPYRRGLLQFTGATLARPDPLGLFRAWATVAAPQTVLILPKRYIVPPVALPGTLKYQHGGVALAAHVGQSEEFVALRDYRRGDPMRHIHWRSWARVGKPIVKEFEDEFFVRHALVLDTFTDRSYSAVFEEAVAVAASFACTVLTQESLLDLLFAGPQAYCFTAGRGLAHADQMLEILAAAQPCPTPSFATLEHLVLNHAGVVSGCICVLLAWDDARRSLVTKLKHLGLPVRVLVIVPAGGGAALDPGPLRDAPEQFQVLEVGKIEQQLARLT
jgi:uncharacterized protein (DUF58 family)